MQRFRGELVSKAHRLRVSLNSRLERNREGEEDGAGLVDVGDFNLQRSGFRDWKDFQTIHLHA